MRATVFFLFQDKKQTVLEALVLSEGNVQDTVLETYFLYTHKVTRHSLCFAFNLLCLLECSLVTDLLNGYQIKSVLIF